MRTLEGFHNRCPFGSRPFRGSVSCISLRPVVAHLSIPVVFQESRGEMPLLQCLYKAFGEEFGLS